MFFLPTNKLTDALRVSSSQPITPARQLISLNPDSDSVRNTAKRLSGFIIGNLYDFDKCLEDPASYEYSQRIDFVVSALYTDKRRGVEESRTLAHVSTRVVEELLKRSEDNDTGIVHPCAGVFRLAVTDAATNRLVHEWEKYTRTSLPLFGLDTLRSASVVYADLVAVGLIGMGAFLSTLQHIKSIAIPTHGLQAALLIATDLMSRASTVHVGSLTLPRDAWTSLVQSLETLDKVSHSEDLEVSKDFATAFECTDMSTGVLDWRESVPYDGDLVLRLHGMCEELWKLGSKLEKT